MNHSRSNHLRLAAFLGLTGLATSFILVPGLAGIATGSSVEVIGARPSLPSAESQTLSDDRFENGLEIASAAPSFPASRGVDRGRSGFGEIQSEPQPDTQSEPPAEQADDATAEAPQSPAAEPQDEEEVLDEALAQEIIVTPAVEKADEEEMVRLGFKDTPVVDTIRFIAETTGKVVMLRLIQVAPTKITLLSDRPVPRREALDLLFKAFRLNGIGVVETEREIIIDTLTDLSTLQDPGVILGPDDNVLSRTDDGSIVNKVFGIRLAKADLIAEQLSELMPSYAKLKVDVNTNQILLEGNVGLAKRVQLLINQLDKPAFINLRTETFRLKHADAQLISDTILDLFESSRTQGGARAGQQRGGQNVRGAPQIRPGGAQGTPEAANVSEQIRVSVLPAINAVVVSAEPEIVDEIGRLIRNYWDISPSERDGDLIRVYTLRYADPVAVRNVLQTMLEGASAGGGRGGARGAAGGARAGGGGGEGGADVAVAGIFRIDAIPDARQLVVISKTPENFRWLDEVVANIDRETNVGLPKLIPLRYANAVEVAEQLNALFAEPGTEASIRGEERGLTRGDVGSASVVEGGTSGGTGGAAGAGGAGGGAQADNVITFPWQSSGGAGTEDRTPESRIIGKVRIVPNIRQNALMVLAAPDLQAAVVDMVTTLDKPGRQVLIAAVIAAVELKDEFAYGLRVSRDGIVTPLSDNSIGIGISNENTENNFLNFFDTSVLNVNVEAVAVLQAIDQKTGVKILQQPKLFISDNTEGVVFIGQEIPFISDSTNNDFGVTQGFDYIPVGVILNVRPRITSNKDVSLEINLTLSNVVSGQTLFGGAILDRRTTETQVTIRNGQTVILSGLRVETQSDIKRRVPLLGSIPVVGDLLFTSTDTADNVSELLAFVTPIVVENPEENDLNFNEDARRRLEDLRRPLKELNNPENPSQPFEPIENPGQIPALPAGAPTPPRSDEITGGGVATSSSAGSAVSGSTPPALNGSATTVVVSPATPATTNGGTGSGTGSGSGSGAGAGAADGAASGSSSEGSSGGAAPRQRGGMGR